MAITVDYTLTPFLITIPKADLTLDTGTRYKLTVDEFWLLLRDFTDNEGTMAQPKLYSRIPATSSTPSITTIDLDFYEMQFEDGLYSVNITEGNTNIREAEVKNQVSVNTNNTTGFIDPTYLQYSTFDGGVWVDESSSVTGIIYPVGTPSKPVNNFADALLICAQRGFKTFNVIGDAVINSGGDYSGFIFVGESREKSIFDIESNANVFKAEFVDATITGTIDGGVTIRDCTIYDINYVNGTLERCVLGGGTILLGGGGQASFLDCWSGVAGELTPVIDCGGTGQKLIMRNYNGGVTLRNKTGVDEVSLGINAGQIVLENTISAGQIIVRGIGTLTDESTGTAVVVSTGLMNKENIALASATHSGTARSSGIGNNQIELDVDASSVDGGYDPSTVHVRSGAGAGQTRLILQYDGPTRIATVDRDWKVLPDSTSKFAILPDAGRAHVHEGLAQAGTISTICLGVLASTTDQIYNQQLVFIRSGTGQDQARIIESYNGTTKIATLSEDWEIAPDSTSAYVMSPDHIYTPTKVANAVWEKTANAQSYATLLQGMETLLAEIHKLQGLDVSNPMTVTPTSRVAGNVTQAITGDGVNTSTVTRTP
jgi:hypothetical protein